MRVLLVLISLFCTGANAGMISYEIIDYTRNPNGIVISSGKIQQKTSDIKVIKHNSQSPLWSKYVEIDHGYQIGLSDAKDPKLTGFGMWAKKDKDSFSWDWFNLKANDQFEKLQEGGLIKVRTAGKPAFEEIAEIEFLSDISLRISSFSSGNTKAIQRVNIKKGSIFSVLP